MLMYKEGEPLRDLRSYYSKDGASQSVEVGAPELPGDCCCVAQQMCACPVQVCGTTAVVLLLLCRRAVPTAAAAAEQTWVVMLEVACNVQRFWERAWWRKLHADCMTASSFAAVLPINPTLWAASRIAGAHPRALPDQQQPAGAGAAAVGL